MSARSHSTGQASSRWITASVILLSASFIAGISLMLSDLILGPPSGTYDDPEIAMSVVLEQIELLESFNINYGERTYELEFDFATEYFETVINHEAIDEEFVAQVRQVLSTTAASNFESGTPAAESTFLEVLPLKAEFENLRFQGEAESLGVLRDSYLAHLVAWEELAAKKSDGVRTWFLSWESQSGLSWDSFWTPHIQQEGDVVDKTFEDFCTEMESLISTLDLEVQFEDRAATICESLDSLEQ